MRCQRMRCESMRWFHRVKGEGEGDGAIRDLGNVF